MRHKESVKEPSRTNEPEETAKRKGQQGDLSKLV